MSTATANPLEEATVGQLVVERPARARVFETFGIDYCCGGRKPLAEVCREKGLDVSFVLAALDQAEAKPGDETRNWGSASLTDLCDHIETTYHQYLRNELPRVEFLTNRVAMRHGDRYPFLNEIRDICNALKPELESHITEEEQSIFPIFRQLEISDELPTSEGVGMESSLEELFDEHDDAGEALAKLRELTDGYAPPADACNTFRAMYDALRELEENMHQHVHTENNILFPKAKRTEQLLRRAQG